MGARVPLRQGIVAAPSAEIGGLARRLVAAAGTGATVAQHVDPARERALDGRPGAGEVVDLVPVVTGVVELTLAVGVVDIEPARGPHRVVVGDGSETREHAFVARLTQVTMRARPRRGGL